MSAGEELYAAYSRHFAYRHPLPWKHLVGRERELWGQVEGDTRTRENALRNVLLAVCSTSIVQGAETRRRVREVLAPVDSKPPAKGPFLGECTAL